MSQQGKKVTTVIFKLIGKRQGGSSQAQQTRESQEAMGRPQARNWVCLPPVLLGLSCCLLLASSSAAVARPPVAAPLLALPNVFGDGMVLQRAPQTAVLWGNASATVRQVTAMLQNHTVVAPVSAGQWTLSLGAWPAGHYGPIRLLADGEEALVLQGVLFGDVLLCSGQSNMVFVLNQTYNSSQYLEEANDPRYRSIRLFSSAADFSPAPRWEFKAVAQAWEAANGTTLYGRPFSTFSALCWFAGREAFLRLGGQVPVGLVVSAVGGTRVHNWSGPRALAQCNQSGAAPGTSSRLWNGMITPVLKMRFRAVLWMQGESDVNPSDVTMEPQRGGAYYGCQFPAMITDWRAQMEATALPFIWVLLSPWVGHEAATSFEQLPAIRAAQFQAQTLPHTAWASALDLGDPDPDTNPWDAVHFRNKAPMGPRLWAALSALAYGQAPPRWEGPVATRAAVVATRTAGKELTTSVVVSFSPRSMAASGSLVFRANVCPFIALHQDSNVARCGWFALQDSAGSWHNASASLGAGARELLVQMPDHVEGAPRAVRYAYADWPVATLYGAATGLPAAPFSLAVHPQR
jgi:hypothetical protein